MGTKFFRSVVFIISVLFIQQCGVYMHVKDSYEINVINYSGSDICVYTVGGEFETYRHLKIESEGCDSVCKSTRRKYYREPFIQSSKCIYNGCSIISKNNNDTVKYFGSAIQGVIPKRKFLYIIYFLDIKTAETTPVYEIFENELFLEKRIYSINELEKLDWKLVYTGNKNK